MKDRETNIELLRILMMLWIILSHYSSHGGLYDSQKMNVGGALAVLFIVGGKIGVNVFVLIMGTFMIEASFRIIHLIKIEMAVLFYSIVFGVITWLCVPNKTWNFISIKNMVFPTLTNASDGYWFVTCYLAVMILSPFINKLVLGLHKYEYELLLAILFIFISIIPSLFQSVPLYDGNTAVFLLMYLTGGYLKKYDTIKINKRVLISLIIVMCGGLIGIILVVRKYQEYFAYLGIYADMLRQCNMFLTVILSVSIFMLFLHLEISFNSLINKIAGITFDIYLIHDNIYFREYAWKGLFHTDKYTNSNYMCIHAIGCTLIIYVGALSLGYLRMLLFKPIITRISKAKFVDKVDNLFRVQ